MPRGKVIPRNIPGFGFLFKPTYVVKSGERREVSKWWLYYEAANGERIRESSGTTDQAIAYEKLVALRAELGRGELDSMEPHSVTFSVLFDLFEKSLVKKATIAQVVYTVAKWLRPTFDTMRVVELRKKDVEAWKAQALKSLKPASVNKLLSFWHRALVLGTMEDPQLVLRVPPWFSKLEVDNARQGIVTYEQYKALKESLPPHAALLLTIGYHLGMRSGEIRGLRWDQVDFDAQEIKLERGQTKGKVARTAPIYGELGPALEMAYASRDPKCPFVVQYRGKRVVASMWETWQRAKELAQVPRGILIHDLRRTAATNMRRAGIDEPTVMRIVGWTTQAMFLRYNIVGPEDMKRAGRTMAAWMDQQREKSETKPKGRTM
jgi:integrase